MTKGLTRSLSRGTALIQHVIKQTIVVEDLSLVVTSVSTAVGFGSVVAEGLPEGNILLLGAVGYLKFDGSGSDANLTATWEGDFSVGTAPVTDTDLTDPSDIDILPSTELAAATAEIGVRTRAAAAAGTMIDNTDGSLEVNINALIDAADITDDESVTLTVNGEIYLSYVMLGDD